MSQPFVGVEAMRDGGLTRGQLRWNNTVIHPGVYLPKDAERTLVINATAAWLWTGRRGIIAGRAAAALHGARWVDDATPIEVIAEHTRRQPGIIVREERIAADEITYVGELPVTTLGRTALDLGRYLDRDAAVAQLDALAAAKGFVAEDVLALADRYRGRRGIRRAREALALMDAGAQSPKETWLRLLLIDAGLPRPRTQIRVTDGTGEAYIDWGSPRLRGRGTTSRRSGWTTKERTTAPTETSTSTTSGGRSSSAARAGSTFWSSPNTVDASSSIVPVRRSRGADGPRRVLRGGRDWPTTAMMQKSREWADAERYPPRI